MITLSKVSKWYPNFQVLKQCSTHVEKGEVVVVCGPSGSGKSTLIKCVNGLEPFQEGTITVAGISVSDRKTDLPKLRACSRLTTSEAPKHSTKYTSAANRYISTSRPSRCATLLAAPMKSVSPTT